MGSEIVDHLIARRRLLCSTFLGVDHLEHPLRRCLHLGEIVGEEPISVENLRARAETGDGVRIDLVGDAEGEDICDIDEVSSPSRGSVRLYRRNSVGDNNGHSLGTLPTAQSRELDGDLFSLMTCNI